MSGINSEFASANLTAGQLNALVKKVGGHDVVMDILRGELEVIVKAISFLVSTQKFTVDFDRTIDDLIRDGKYDWTGNRINDLQIFSHQVGTHEIEFGMFHFNKKRMTSEDVIAKMRIEGFCPAKMKELLSYGKKNPEKQRNYVIIALGSVNEFSYCGRHIVGGLGEKNFVDAYDPDAQGGCWGTDDHFLAVRE